MSHGTGSDWFVAAEGCDAMGHARPAPAQTAPAEDPEIEAAIAAAEAEWTKGKAPDSALAKPRTRKVSKQSEVIRMLRRPGERDGAPDLRSERMAGAHGTRDLRRRP